MKKEYIPDEDRLFIRLGEIHFLDDKLLPDAFMPRMSPDDCGVKSANWGKYSTPQKTMEETKIVKFNRMCALIEVGFLRREIGLEATHFPKKNNYSHSGIHSLQQQQPLREGCDENFSFNQPSVI